jgi:hypothetical protein
MQGTATHHVPRKRAYCGTQPDYRSRRIVLTDRASPDSICLAETSVLLAELSVLGDTVDPLLGTWQVDADVQASLAPIGEADIPVVLPYDGSGDRKAQSTATG